jgi:ribulose-5-phosphate 4-epimerase/fuculose-1-phosphate aldolase
MSVVSMVPKAGGFDVDAGVPMMRVPETEWEQRVDLAACYRLADKYRMGKVIWNHITARVPGTVDEFLVFRLGCRYDEVTASNLLKMNLDGRTLDGRNNSSINETAYVIHAGIYRHRPDVMCVMHGHSRAGQAVSCLKDGLLPLSQEAMMFYEDIAYHDYEGISDDLSESDRLAATLGQRNQMILRNHGLITVGKTVGEAFWRMYTLEMACGLQMDVLSSGLPYTLQPPETCRKVRDQYLEDFHPGAYEWPALLRGLDREAPGYAL